MREDVDFVTMESYTADTAELRNTAVAAIDKLRYELRQAERLIWHLVNAAGGQLSITHAALTEKDGLVLERHDNDQHARVTFVAKRVPAGRVR